MTDNVNELPANTEKMSGKFENLSDADLVSELNTAISSASQKADSENVATQEPAKTTPETPAETVQADKVQSTGQEQKVENVPEDSEAFKQLQEKQGFKNVESLEKSVSELQKQTGNNQEKPKTVEELVQFYKNLQQDFHAKRQPQNLNAVQQPQPNMIQQPVPQNIQPQVNEQYNERLLEQINKDPLNTIATIADLVATQRMSEKMASYEEIQRDLLLKNEVARLSSSPETGDFNTPQIQAKMQQIASANPEKYSDLTSNMTALYWMAKGMLSAAQQAAQVKPSEPRVVKKAPPVEGKSKSAQGNVVTNPNEMDLGSLEKMILTHPDFARL